MTTQTKEKLYILIIALLIATAAQFYYSFRYRPVLERQVNVYYNQERELNKEIINEIRDADKYVYFAVYTFTRADIKDALARKSVNKLISLLLKFTKITQESLV